MDENYGWLRPYLGAEERILWRGRPEKIRLLEASDAFMIPFSLLWGGFAIYWEYSVLRMNAPFIFPVFGGFFVLIGLYMIFGRFFYKSFILKRTSYAVTSEKVLINRNGKIEVLMKNALPSFSIKRKEDGSGTITFHTSRAAFGFQAFSRPWKNYDPLRICCVENVDRALQAIQAKE